MITVVSGVEWDHSQSPSSYGLAAIWVLMRADRKNSENVWYIYNLNVDSIIFQYMISK